MKILVLMDKFKDSLSAKETSSVISAGLKSSGREIDVTTIPLADGGDGTIDALECIEGSKMVMVKTLDPLGRSIEVPVLIIGKRAICEMAQSTGLTLLTKEERNPLYTSSYGLGLVIKGVADMGIDEIVVGIGGSATNDCGVGMLQALGCRFIDSAGETIRGATLGEKVGSREIIEWGEIIRGEDLIKITRIDSSLCETSLTDLKITVASDVTNPLTGIYGATRVYGPQKGATQVIVEELEAGVTHFAEVATKFFGRDYSAITGAGAAGGIGFAFASFLGAELRQGWRILFDLLEVEREIERADLVITGEGRVDGQSLSGKLLDGVSTICAKFRKRLWVICGDNLLTEKELERAGVERLFSISEIEPIKERAIKNARQYIYEIAGQAMITI
jgi:glycerate kinase